MAHEKLATGNRAVFRECLLSDFSSQLLASHNYLSDRVCHDRRWSAYESPIFGLGIGVQQLLSEPEFVGVTSKIAVFVDYFVRRHIARAVQMAHVVVMRFI